MDGGAAARVVITLGCKDPVKMPLSRPLQTMLAAGVILSIVKLLMEELFVPTPTNNTGVGGDNVC